MRTLLENGVLLSTIETLRTEDATSLETVLSAEISERWRLDLSADVFYNQIDARNLGFAGDRSVMTGSGRALVAYRPTDRTRVQINAFHLFPRITPPGRRQSISYLNGGIDIAFSAGRGSLTVTGSDIFNSYRVRRTIDTEALSRVASIRRSRPTLLIGVTWRFRDSDDAPEMVFEGTDVRR